MHCILSMSISYILDSQVCTRTDQNKNSSLSDGRWLSFVRDFIAAIVHLLVQQGDPVSDLTQHYENCAEFDFLAQMFRF